MSKFSKAVRKPKATIILIAGVILILSVLLAVMYTYRQTGSPHNLNKDEDSIRAIDTANTITDKDWFSKAYDEGFRLYILHATDWDTCNGWYRTQPQLKMAIDAGLKVGVYTRDPRCWQEGILATGPYIDSLQFFALDIETKPGIAATREMVNGIKNMGVRPVIYTGSGMWDDVQAGNDEDFSDVALWDTNVKDFDYHAWVADYMQPVPVQYGGWNTPTTMRIGIQQQFEYTLNGINVDLNSFDAQFLK